MSATETIRLGNPGELIAGIPYLLGFHPEQSLVVVCLSNRRVAMTARVDLADLADPRLMDGLAGPIGRAAPDMLLLVVIGAGDLDATLDAVQELLDVVNVPGDVFVAQSCEPGTPWFSGDDGSGGVVGDSSVLAAATVVAGQVTHASREEMAGCLAPDPGAESRVPVGDMSGARDDLLSVLATVAGMVGRDLSDGDYACAAQALTDVRVRDACASWSLLDEGTAASVETLWLDLTRGVPRSYRAGPATLLGLAAYLRGNGALASDAFETALVSQPGYSWASLLVTALRSGVSPEHISQAMSDAADQGVL